MRNNLTWRQTHGQEALWEESLAYLRIQELMRENARLREEFFQTQLDMQAKILDQQATLNKKEEEIQQIQNLVLKGITLS